MSFFQVLDFALGIKGKQPRIEVASYLPVRRTLPPDKMKR